MKAKVEFTILYTNERQFNTIINFLHNHNRVNNLEVKVT